MRSHVRRSAGVLILGAILSTSWPTIAGVGQASKSAASSDDRADRFEALRRSAFDALYSLDYETSEKLFNQIVELEPQHPAGYLYLATQEWMGQLNRTRRLQTSIYSGSSFYSKTGEKIDQKVDRRFRDYAQKAIEKAESRLKKNDRDLQARYFLGAAYAVLAGYEGSVTREFFAALKHGRRSVKEHRQVIKQDPNFADAYLTIGIYNYIVGSLPTWVRILATLGGIRGSKQRGIEDLQRVAEKGKYARYDARVLLIAVYTREKEYQKALDMVGELADRYPQNYLLPIEKANLLVRMGRKQEGFNAFEAMLQSEQFHQVDDLIRFQYAQTLSTQGYKTAALYHYRKVTGMPNASPQLVSLAHLSVGRLLDLKGEREAAIAEYKVVLNGDNVFDSHQQAQNYLRKPYRGKE